LAEPIQLLDQRQESIAAATLGVQIHEFRGFARIFADALQIVVLDEDGNEALFVLQLHRIEHATIRVNTDQVFVFGLKIVGHD
jgi:hypothetical protein